MFLVCGEALMDVFALGDTPGGMVLDARIGGSPLNVAIGLARLGQKVEFLGGLSSGLLPSVPAGVARALMAMFLVSHVHPFTDGNGRLARLTMNAELSVVNGCRIIVPTLFREEYLDCLRVLTRDGEPQPFLQAMQEIHAWTAAFDYEDIDAVIALMQQCHAFEKSRIQFKLLEPSQVAAPTAGPTA